MTKREMTEFTVHFEKGRRVGTRSLHMVRVEAETVKEAVRKARAEHETWGDAHGYRMTRVDHFEDGRIVIDR
jgi:hypothetical protein